MTDRPAAPARLPRVGGIATLPGRRLERHAWQLDNDAFVKLALVRHDPSQLLAPPRSIDAFTPATEPATLAHEAVWSEESSGPA